ncbi:N-acetyl sugar amidotransferase [Thalassospira tepidiphila]|uniref:N-acetyl sugar amidotransferase n=1 Tax=Thalassospira tepidiphila TaxID=393657 RepID=UPI003AA99FA1
MNYCKQCILPDSRPNLVIGEDGICNACKEHKKKEHVNWDSREKLFQQLVADTKDKASPHGWDCIIPVSGGKDSTWQVIKCLEYGLKPLCVTWRTPVRTDIGQKNLNNLISLGVDHFDVSLNPKVEKQFTIATLERCGSPAIPMHMALFALPLNIATKFKIPLILWGENSAAEYGGSDSALMGHTMTRSWLIKYGVTNGTVAEDWVDQNLSAKQLSAYSWPSEKTLKESGVVASFMGWYFNWDPVMTFNAAKEKGFQALDSKPMTGFYKFADIDDQFLITIHHWIKWYKFGFTRLWDNLSLEIRNGRLTRDDAIQIVSHRGDETPHEEIDQFCDWAEISTESFHQKIRKFRNKQIWSNDGQKWRIEDFLIEDWEWR